MKDNKDFLKKINENLEKIKEVRRINLDGHPLSRTDLEDIRDVLGDNTNLTEIHASKIGDAQSNLSFDRLEILAEIIGKNPDLEKLTLSDNMLDYPSIAYLMFVLSLKFQDRQIELHLSNCGLEKDSLQLLLTSPNIEELHVHGYDLENLDAFNFTAGKLKRVSLVSGKIIPIEREEVISSPEEELYSNQWLDGKLIQNLNIKEDIDILQSARELGGGKEEEQENSWQSRHENASPSDLEDESVEDDFTPKSALEGEEKENIDPETLLKNTPQGITPIISETEKKEFYSNMQKILRDGPKSPTQYAQKKEFSESSLGR